MTVQMVDLCRGGHEPARSLDAALERREEADLVARVSREALGEPGLDRVVYLSRHDSVAFEGFRIPLASKPELGAHVRVLLKAIGLRE